jgi:hypothetical protein
MTGDRPPGVFQPPGAGKSPALNGFVVDGHHGLYALSNFGGIYRIVQR